MLPPSGEQILKWLAVSAEFVQASTVLSWMASLRAALADFQIDTSIFDSRDFVMFRQGIKRVKGEQAPRTALPITLPMLTIINHTILERGPASAQDRLALAAAYALAFACFLRIGEITYSKFDPLLHLQRRDVLFGPQGNAIRLKGSKMDPSRKGVILPLPTIRDPAYNHVCPSYLLRLLLDSSPGCPDDPLFRFSAGQQGFEAKRLVQECRQALIMNGFSIMDMDGRVFSGHSFRRGAATWGARVGLDD
jgi:integrase